MQRGTGRRAADGMHRREFLRRAVVAGIGIPGAAAALAACSRPTGIAPGAPLAPEARGRWPIHADNPPIEGDLPIERGATLRVYEWRDYLARNVLEAFERRYRSHDVRVQVESFLHMEEAIARLRRPDGDFDIFFPTIDAIGGLVDARVLLPLNHDYLPNLRNLWPEFRGSANPFYDEGQRYTVPYTTYSSGIGWRRDLVAAVDAPDASDDPFGLLWNSRYRGRAGVYDSYREAMALGLLHRGETDLGGAGTAALRDAADDLIRLVRNGGKLTLEGAYEGLPDGEFAAHQAWSGDLISAARYGRRSRAGSEDALGFSHPDGGVVGCDLTAVCSRGRNPVLAHAFVNHLLDFDVAMDNFAWNGYQPPLEGATRDAFADPAFRWSRIVPDNLLEAIVTPEQFQAGTVLLRLGAAGETRWIQQWNRVRAAAASAGAIADAGEGARGY
jgi:spermidine/putrescine transport system substrate-binding protein